MDQRIFINYRGADSSSYGALLYTELVRQFGERHVFLDCESIPAGADFAAELLSRVRSARVVLAVIGPHWLADATGRRPIDDRDDWIRRELVEAFAAGVRVVPILTDDATLPAEAELPADIAVLGRCQARPLRRREPVGDLARIVADLIAMDPAMDPGMVTATGQAGVVNTITGHVSGTVVQAGTITGGVHLR
ncbi:MAG TPA: toll/interleukin-1 receptor domain-containing protein [Pseudonocardiaceae bacterium]|nr:toll/interleukin-1 receptor domain-containing protein [Pseudonocardiaceae bacterium]